jgi:4-amino-4-deoxy-L-arabinose transferase-like glycosyltransferase
MEKFRIYFLITILAALFYIPFIGNVSLFDWDEVNFAEISREMVVTQNYLQVQEKFMPFYEKPPLFFWLQSVSMQTFGVNEFAARFPNTLIGIFTLIILFRIGSRLFNPGFGMIWALTYFGSILPFLYFKSGIIDPLFNLFIFLGLYQFLKFKWKNEGIHKSELRLPRGLYLFNSALFIGLAMMTKGPVAYLIVILSFVVYFAWKQLKLFISIPHFISFTLIAWAVIFAWLGLETFYHGATFMNEFIAYQVRLFSTPDAGHAGFPGFHVIVLLLGCFPASIFAIRGFYKSKPDKDFQQDFRTWMIILFWVVFVLFSIVQSKIVHYSSMAYFPITFLASLVISNLIDGKIRLTPWMLNGLIAVISFFAIIMISAPVVGRNIHWIKPFFQKNMDTLASLDAQVHWSGWECIPGILLLAVLLFFLIGVHRQKLLFAMRTLFLGTALVVFTGLIFFIGRIEMYSQNANVDFSKSLKGKECYIKTSGFKSYIPEFYSKRMPPVHAKSDDIGWLTWENADKDVYIIAKSHLKSYWSDVPTVEIINEKNGFLFVKRTR